MLQNTLSGASALYARGKQLCWFQEEGERVKFAGQKPTLPPDHRLCSGLTVAGKLFVLVICYRPCYLVLEKPQRLLSDSCSSG